MSKAVSGEVVSSRVHRVGMDLLDPQRTIQLQKYAAAAHQRELDVKNSVIASP